MASLSTVQDNSGYLISWWIKARLTGIERNTHVPFKCHHGIKWKHERMSTYHVKFMFICSWWLCFTLQSVHRKILQDFRQRANCGLLLKRDTNTLIYDMHRWQKIPATQPFLSLYLQICLSTRPTAIPSVWLLSVCLPPWLQCGGKLQTVQLPK